MYNPQYNTYGNQYNPYQQQNSYYYPQTQPQANTNTNKIYVSGIDDVRNRFLAPNSDYIFLDNDKPVLYQKVVDSKGQFEVKEFEITQKSPELDTKNENTNKLSSFVKKSEFDALKLEFQALKTKFAREKLDAVKEKDEN